MAEDPHESEKYLVRWAKAKVEDLAQRSDGFVNSDSTYALVVDFDEKAGKQFHKIVLKQEFPWELRGIAADTVKTLRDALDQSVLHCTQRIRRPKGKGTHFPFGENPADFDDVLSGKTARQSKDLAPELHPILRSFQPYPTGQGYTGGNDRLRHIGRVSGPNKHELTLTVGVTPDAFHIRNIFNPMGFGHIIYAPHWNAAKNEALVLESHINAHIDIDLDFASYIAFDHPLIGRYPIHLVLRQWTEIVEDIVTRLIAETDRLTGS